MHTGRGKIISFSKAFHGRTSLSVMITDNTKLHAPVNVGHEVIRLEYNQEAQLEEHITDEVAAVILEPVQGVGGINVARQGFLDKINSLIKKHKVLLVMDEVQSGFCRTGKWAAYDHFDLKPDLSTWAKSMGSGMPIACVLGKAEIMDAAKPSTIGGTYIGNPVSCAASLATLKLMEEQDLNTRGTEVGEIVRDRFNKMKAKYPAIGDVRGLGAMMAMEFVKNGDPRQPDPETCSRLLQECGKRGLILISAGTHKNVIRVLSPLVISDDQLHKGLDIIDESLAEILS